VGKTDNFVQPLASLAPPDPFHPGRRSHLHYDPARALLLTKHRRHLGFAQCGGLQLGAQGLDLEPAFFRLRVRRPLHVDRFLRAQGGYVLCLNQHASHLSPGVTPAPRHSRTRTPSHHSTTLDHTDLADSNACIQRLPATIGQRKKAGTLHDYV
jgi:hypothetical protein